ncbi:MAG: FMN-binding protein [Acidimicrobiales bacterium]
MRRAPVVIAASVAGMAGVLGFHTTQTSIAVSIPGSTSSSTGSSAGSSSAGSHSSKPSSSGSSSGAGTSSGSSSGAGTSSGSSSGAGTSSGSSSGAATAPPSSSATSGAVRSAVGTTEQYGYGQLAVRVTVTGRKITNVALASIQVAESYSASIAQQVIPMLRSEVLSAQSANINGISGASYTVAAYAASLQSALNKLHV